uniref:Monodehydroascorbate reductase n=1 Tax=Tanacetum cinerariifolium TaxID=118510 RepID=A0A6L2L4Z3_TANCI|nr:hypothetical protein [Tanacetum cinerariifolium]
MTDVNINVNAPAEQAPTMAPPTRIDDQILPQSRWVPVGKSNCYLDVEKSQSNPIYKIAVDILKHTNFFRAFTASLTIPSIYIQQFWDTIRYDRETARYICQLDEQWFDLTKDTLRDALQITPVNNNNPSSSPPTPDALINFVNNLGYPKVVKTLSTVVTNDMFQPFSGASSIEPILIMQRGCGNNSPNPSIPSSKTKRIWHCILRERRKPNPKYYVHQADYSSLIKQAQIPREQYYKEYLEKVAKHQRYLAGEEGSDTDSPAPKPAKATKKSKPSAPKATPVTKPAAAKASESTSSQQPKLKPAPAKTQDKKHDFVDEGILEREPRFDDEEADMQMAVKESLKSVHDVHRGSLLPVVFREPDFGKFQSLPEVQGKGKEKESDEQVSLDLLTLQTPKKVSPVEQYIFQRRTPALTKPSGHAESPSIYAELGLTDSDTESDEEVPLVIKIGAQDKGQVGPNPGVLIEGQAGLNPGDDAERQPQSSPFVHGGPNLEHMDLKASDVSTQQNPEQIEEGFTANAYPNVHENLKLIVNEHMILEEPASSTRTLSFLQHLAKDFSFGYLFFKDKPSEAENDKTTAKTKADSMVSITIHQDTSAIPPMTSPMIDLISRPDSPNDHQPLPTTVSKAVNEIVTDAVDWAIQALFQNCFRDLPEADMKEILHRRMWETNSYKAHEDHMMLYEALEKSINCDHTDELLTDLAEARRKKKKRHDSPKTPPGSPPHQPPPPSPPAGPSGTSRSSGASGSSQLPPPPRPLSTSQSDHSKSTAAPSSSKTAASAEYTALTTTYTRLRPSVSAILADLHMDDDIALDEQVHSSATPELAWSIPSSDLPVPRNNWASALASTYTPPPENSLLAQTGDMAIFMDRFCKKQEIIELKPQDLEGPTFDLDKVFHPNVIHLQYQMEECHKLLTDRVDESIIRYNVSKPLPLGGPPGQVTIQSDFFFNKDLEYLQYSSKGGRPAVTISKMKVAYYPDVGLEQMVPDQMWIEKECKYYIAAIAVRTHMRILSVVRIKVFSIYGYDYMKKIILRRADLNEHIILERDFKYLYPSDFEDLQRVKDFQLGIESY